MNEQMRHADTSVSWYRGPCPPFSVTEEAFVSASSPDAVNRYNPQTGLFDVSYAAAWQLGQLMALQNKNYANALFNWKKSVNSRAAMQAEQQILQERLGRSGFGQHARVRPAHQRDGGAGRIAAATPRSRDAMAQQAQAPLRRAVRLPGAERADGAARIPGASSIWIRTGSTISSTARSASAAPPASSKASMNARPCAGPCRRGQAHAKRQRKQQRFAANAQRLYTGFLLRSQVVAGWPNLQVNGYAVPDDIHSEIMKLRMDRISADCIICIFDGEAKQVAIHEPPEQLHCGIEIDMGGIAFGTTLRGHRRHALRRVPDGPERRSAARRHPDAPRRADAPRQAGGPEHPHEAERGLRAKHHGLHLGGIRAGDDQGRRESQFQSAKRRRG